MLAPATTVRPAPRADPLERRIARATFAILVVTTLAKVLGFVEKQLIAYRFGAGPEVDAYFVAVSVVLLFFLLVRELIEPGFMAVFSRSLAADEQRRAWGLFRVLALVVLLVTGTYAAVLWSFAPRVIETAAPGLGAEALRHGALLVRTLAPAVVFLGLSALTYITLNALRSFAVPAAGDLALKLGPILGALLLWEGLGVAALAVGFAFGALVRLALHAAGLTGHMRSVLDRRARVAPEDLRAFAWLTLPLVLGAAFSFLSELADNYFASLTGEGGVSARSYAKRIRDLPIEVLPQALSIVLFPFFARMAARGECGRLRSLLAGSAHGLALVFAPVAVGLYVFSEPTVSLLFERGAFGAPERAAVAWPLRMYALGMVTFAVETVLVNLFFAMRDTLTPIAVGLGCVVLNVLLTALLIRGLGPGGVALALTVSKTAKVVVLAGFLPRKLPGFRWGALGAVTARIALASALCAWVLLVYRGLLEPELAAAGVASKALFLLGGATAGASAFFGTILLASRHDRRLVLGWPAKLRLLWSAAESRDSRRL